LKTWVAWNIPAIEKLFECGCDGYGNVLYITFAKPV